MNIILTDGDQRYINDINENINSGGDYIPRFVDKVGDRYYIDFEITDVGKASVFVATMLNEHYSSMLNDVCGIKVKCLRWDDSSSKINALKELLLKQIQELDELENQ